MGSQRMKKSTKEQILKSALALFKKKGFEKTSMRDIAKDAGVALGAAYYYFKTKEELVFEFYRGTQVESEEKAREIFQTTKSFEKRFRESTLSKLEQLKPYRRFISILAASALDAKNPVSPLSPDTKDVRDQAIALFAECIEGSDLQVPKSLAPHLPKMVWLFHMAILLFWVHDDSKDQKRTQKLLDLTMSTLLPLLGMASLPFMEGANDRLVSIFKLLEEKEGARA